MIEDKSPGGGVRGVATDSPSHLLGCVIENFLHLSYDPPEWLMSKLKVQTIEVYYLSFV